MTPDSEQGVTDERLAELIRSLQGSPYKYDTDLSDALTELTALRRQLREAGQIFEDCANAYELDADMRKDEQSPFTKFCRDRAALLRALASTSAKGAQSTAEPVRGKGV